MANMLNRVPLNALRTFEAAARHLSFSDAAEELGVTPSAVSLQVRRLEDQIGRPLFLRGHRTIELSETGARLAPRLRELFSNMDQLLTDVVAPQSMTLRITAMPSFASTWLAQRLPRFTSAHRHYRVRVEGNDALFSFERDDADIGLRYGAGDYSGLYCQKLAPAVAFPVCSPEFAALHAEKLRSPSDLTALPLLHDEIAERAEGLPTWSAWFAAAGAPYDASRGGPVFDSFHMARAAALAGQGVALGLAPMIDDDLAAGRLLRLFEVAVPSAYGFWLVCRAGREGERKIAAFRAWIAAEFAAGA